MNAAIQGHPMKGKMQQHRSKVIWKAPGQRNQIEAPFAMQETGHIGLVGLEGGRSRESVTRGAYTMSKRLIPAEDRGHRSHHFMDVHLNRNKSHGRADALAVANMADPRTINPPQDLCSAGLGDMGVAIPRIEIDPTLRSHH